MKAIYVYPALLSFLAFTARGLDWLRTRSPLARIPAAGRITEGAIWTLSLLSSLEIIGLVLHLARMPSPV
jgi:hypothetical protein